MLFWIINLTLSVPVVSFLVVGPNYLGQGQGQVVELFRGLFGHIGCNLTFPSKHTVFRDLYTKKHIPGSKEQRIWPLEKMTWTWILRVRNFLEML